MMLLKHRHLFELTGLFAISLCLFTIGLSHSEVVGFESRFYLFAREMFESGPTWFPTVYHNPYPDYPATSTFLIYLIAKFVGHLNKLIAVMPSAIAASITVIMTYSIGAKHSKRFGFYSIVFLFGTIAFLKTARSIEIDMYCAMFTAISFYLIYSANQQKKSLPIFPILLCLFLSFAIRGPIGLVVPAGVICTYYLINFKYKNFFIIGFFSSVLLVICTLLLLFLAYQTGGKIFVSDVLRMQILGRIDNVYQPIYFYFTNGLSNYALSLPTSFLVSFGVFYSIYKKKNASDDEKLISKFLVWMLIVMLGLSIPGDKKIRYILPMVPAASLISAYIFISDQNYFQFFRRVFLRISLVLPAIFFILCGYFFYYLKKNNWNMDLPITTILISLVLLQVMAIFIFLKKDSRHFMVFTIGIFSFVLIEIMIIEPVLIHLDKAKDFVEQTEIYRKTHQAKLVFYKEKPDGLPIKYLINMEKIDRPIFLEQISDLIAFKNEAIFITSEDYFLALSKTDVNQFIVIRRDKLGHNPVVVFVKRRHP
jgi:4-amino-4-deoxy-L-arabinose transferase-like glycosyltransferase